VLWRKPKREKEKILRMGAQNKLMQSKRLTGGGDGGAASPAA